VAKASPIIVSCEPSHTARALVLLNTHGGLDARYDGDAQKLYVNIDTYGMHPADRACELSRVETWVSECARRPIDATSWYDWCARKGLKP
jgi:hypothetical protein